MMATMREGFVVYSLPNCSFCTKAKTLLDQGGWFYSEVDCQGPEERRQLKAKVPPEVTKLTVPQIWHGDRYIGGATALESYLKTLKAKEGKHAAEVSDNK